MWFDRWRGRKSRGLAIIEFKVDGRKLLKRKKVTDFFLLNSLSPKKKPLFFLSFYPVLGLLGRYTSRYALAAFSSALIAASGPSKESTETFKPFFSALE